MLKNTSAKELSNFIITNFVVPGNGQLLWQTDNSIAINLKSYSQNTFNQVMFGNDVQCRYTFNFAPIDNDLSTGIDCEIIMHPNTAREMRSENKATRKETEKLVNIFEITFNGVYRFGMDYKAKSKGLLITDITQGGAFQFANINVGETIVSLNGKTVKELGKEGVDDLIRLHNTIEFGIENSSKIVRNVKVEKKYYPPVGRNK